MISPTRMPSVWIRRVAASSALVWWIGCGGDGGTGIEVPSLHVTTTTSGVDQDADGYFVAVDNGTERPIGTGDELGIASLSVGSHIVTLTGVAPNCTVLGENPRAVQVSSDRQTEVPFSIECRPFNGAVRVVTTTTGPDQDVDGYVLVVDGDAHEIGSNTSVVVDEVPAGSRIVEILGVAANCVARTSTFIRLTLIGGDTVEVSFSFDCSSRQPETGTLQVSTTTTGPSPDPDGYLVSVDDGPPTTIPTNGNALLTGVLVGTRLVGVSGVAGNCAVSGPNPRSATVSGTEVVVLTFSVVCTTPPPSTGSLRITTATTGDDPDPDGYTISVDNGVPQPVGANATISIASVAAGLHTVTLSGLAPNCTSADNPRSVTVPAGGPLATTFGVACVPATGTIATTTVTTGGSIDPDGYVARVDGGAGKEVPPNGTVTRAGLVPGPHTVQLDNVAENCQVQGENPQTAAVSGNATTPVTFQVTCAATTGVLSLSVTGLPGGVSAAVAVTGPNDYHAPVTSSTTLPDLVPGDYAVSAAEVTVGADTYRPSLSQQTITVAAGAALSLTITYSRAGGVINLRIDGSYLTQATQRPDATVPLVEGRAGHLRVFVVASGQNTLAPEVRVRLYQDGVQVSTLRIAAPASSTPTFLQESPLTTSWNVRIPGNLIKPGLALLAEVDPDGQIAESDETDNMFPLSGAPKTLQVRHASALALRVVPVQVGPGGLTGDVTSTTLGRFLVETSGMYPLPAIDADLHGVFTSSLGPLQPNDENGAWSTTLSELYALRVAEGSARSYYGVLRTGYSSGIVGLGYIGLPAAIGWDNASLGGKTTAHELGHNWGRRHAPCGGPGGPDPAYPYVGGTIGVFGFDLETEALIPTSRPDIMGYCSTPWVSDYTYTGVLAYREANQPATEVASMAPRGPALLVWGRIENGRVVLEPAFFIETRPVLPTKPGPFRVDGLAAGGRRVFSIAFDATPVADSPRDARHFAFAVPLSPSSASQLSTLQLSGPSGVASLSATTAELPDAAVQTARARRSGNRVLVEWDAGASPMVMIRDASSGDVLAFARGGRAEVSSSARELDLHLSNQVGSRPIRLVVTP